ncbi:MAG: RNA-directed DNA polymerase [Firmicutes bacterium]|nr:RNA-directed DNA polymerase [Bacillota bacterium]
MIDTPYSTFHDFNVVKRAHEVARLGKRSKSCVVKFEMAEPEHLTYLQIQLLTKTYQMGQYFSFVVYEPKPRKIQAVPYRDRIVQRLMCDHVLVPYFTQKIIYDNCGCVKGRGQHYAVARFKKFMGRFWHQHRRNGWFLKCDIAKFFPSFSHDVIKAAMSSHITDPDVRKLFEHIVDSFHTEQAFLRKHNIPTHEDGKIIPRGVPIGNHTSQIIAVFYMNPLDRFLKEHLRIRNYIRYMDDFVIIHHDKEYLQNVLGQIRNFLRTELKLELNAKTQIIPIKNGVKFLGRQFFLDDNGRVIVRVIKRTARRFKSCIKRINKYHADMEPSQIRSAICSYIGHFRRTNSRGKAAQIKRHLRVSINKRESARNKMFDDFE